MLAPQESVIHLQYLGTKIRLANCSCCPRHNFMFSNEYSEYSLLIKYSGFTTTTLLLYHYTYYQVLVLSQRLLQVTLLQRCMQRVPPRHLRPHTGIEFVCGMRRWQNDRGPWLHRICSVRLCGRTRSVRYKRTHSICTIYTQKKSNSMYIRSVMHKFSKVLKGTL